MKICVNDLNYGVRLNMTTTVIIIIIIIIIMN
jgi:hypothetical protein